MSFEDTVKNYHRGRYEILLSLLDFVYKHPSLPKTQIMYKNNMNMVSMKRYFDYLVDNGFIGAENQLFYITDKGYSLLLCWWGVKRHLSGKMVLEEAGIPYLS